MASPSVTLQRRQQALGLLGAGYGCTELVAKLASEWGCSRRTSRRLVSDAYKELVSDLDEVQAADMLAQLVNRLEQVARLAAESNQHACVIGACRLLSELVVSPHRNRTPAHFGRFGRSGTHP